ncbi:hypothetical protein D7V86_01385 [bacterium D16-51]|nr:hypothetical protein D7V96_03935 [bacterium D16-59]RKI62880.1 hypothetical protein D7V86_01385 [bacterium D16-51]
MDDIRNLSGTLMKRDKCLVKFMIKDYIVVYCELLASTDKCPVEFQWARTKEDALLLYLKDRLPPETRIGLQWYLKAAGIPYYDPERIIKYSHGYNVSDKEWIQLDGEEYTFKQIEDRAIRESKNLYKKMEEMMKTDI